MPNASRRPRRRRSHAEARQGRTVLSGLRRAAAQRSDVPSRLAAILRANDYDVIVVDAAITPDYKQQIEREIHDALCLGISVLTGPMIDGAIEVATAVKKLRPQLPVVFGGWHPTLLPDQTLSEEFVDYVVRRQGEITFLELVNAIREKRDCDSIAGVSWKSAAKNHHNADRPTDLLDALPIPAYDLVDFDAYERVSGERKLAYATSVGCPYACNYCTDMVFYKRRFNALSADRVVQEMSSLASRYRIAEIALLDSNFPVDVRRAIAISKGICDSGVQFRWTFQASTDFLCRMSDDEIRTMRASGVTHMGFGTESTSEVGLEADEQAAPAHGRGVRHRAQSQPRRNSRYVQSHFRISGRDRRRSATNVPHDERNRPRISQRQFLAQRIHSLSGHPNLAAIAGDGGPRAAVTARVGAAAAGRKCIAMAARTGPGAVAAHAGLLSAEQPYAQEAVIVIAGKRSATNCAGAGAMANSRRQVFFSMGDLVGPHNRAMDRTPLARDWTSAPETKCRYMQLR